MSKTTTKVPPFRRYAILKDQIATLTAELDDTKAEIVDSIDEKTETEFGTFTPYPVTTYEYSDKVVKLAERLKLAKIAEEEKGIAKVKNVTNTFKFTPVKK